MCVCLLVSAVISVIVAVVDIVVVVNDVVFAVVVFRERSTARDFCVLAILIAVNNNRGAFSPRGPWVEDS